jgi:hypothetical protein
VFEYVGNLHVHSRYSDGRRSIEEIAQIAAEQGLDFVGINDHNTLRGLAEVGEGWREGVFVLIGEEVGLTKHHYIAYGIERAIAPCEGNPQKVIDEVRNAGGIGFIAHPHERGSPFDCGGRAFTWDDWSVHDYTGISIWCHCSGWKGTATNVLTAIHNYYRHRWSFTGPYPETLSAFDTESCRRHISLIGSSDAHEVVLGKRPFRVVIFPYAVSFGAVNMHLVLRDQLIGDNDADRIAILNALRSGNGFVGYDALCSSTGFRFSAVRGGGNGATMGEEITLRDDMELVVQAPARGIIRIIRDGRKVFEDTATTVSYRLERQGTYRAEVMSVHGLRRPRPWIFSNPIYVREH